MCRKSPLYIHYETPTTLYRGQYRTKFIQLYTVQWILIRIGQVLDSTKNFHSKLQAVNHRLGFASLFFISSLL